MFVFLYPHSSNWFILENAIHRNNLTLLAIEDYHSLLLYLKFSFNKLKCLEQPKGVKWPFKKMTSGHLALYVYFVLEEWREHLLKVKWCSYLTTWERQESYVSFHGGTLMCARYFSNYLQKHNFIHLRKKMNPGMGNISMMYFTCKAIFK